MANVALDSVITLAALAAAIGLIRAFGLAPGGALAAAVLMRTSDLLGD